MESSDECDAVRWEIVEPPLLLPQVNQVCDIVLFLATIKKWISMELKKILINSLVRSNKKILFFPKQKNEKRGKKFAEENLSLNFNNKQ